MFVYTALALTHIYCHFGWYFKPHLLPFCTCFVNRHLTVMCIYFKIYAYTQKFEKYFFNTKTFFVSSAFFTGNIEKYVSKISQNLFLVVLLRRRTFPKAYFVYFVYRREIPQNRVHCSLRSFPCWHSWRLINKLNIGKSPWIGSCEMVQVRTNIDLADTSLASLFIYYIYLTYVRGPILSELFRYRCVIFRYYSVVHIWRTHLATP